MFSMNSLNFEKMGFTMREQIKKYSNIKLKPPRIVGLHENES